MMIMVSSVAAETKKIQTNVDNSSIIYDLEKLTTKPHIHIYIYIKETLDYKKKWEKRVWYDSMKTKIREKKEKKEDKNETSKWEQK